MASAIGLCAHGGVLAMCALDLRNLLEEKIVGLAMDGNDFRFCIVWYDECAFFCARECVRRPSPGVLRYR